MIVYLIIASSILVADRITKLLALSYCIERCSINSYLSFEVIYNRGISWGLFHSSSNYVFAAVSLGIAAITTIVAVDIVIRSRSQLPILGEVLVVAGSCANLFDRASYGGVVDFIGLSYGSYSWPLFNIADISIVLGVAIMIWEYYRS